MRRMQAHYANRSPKLPSLTALLLGGVQRPNKVLLEHLWLSSFSFCQRSFKAIQFGLMATVAARFGRRERLIEHAISLSCVAGFDESVTEQSKIARQGQPRLPDRSRDPLPVRLLLLLRFLAAIGQPRCKSSLWP